jgi:hypothetical protein
MNYSIRDPSAGSASQLIFSSMEMLSCSSVNDQRQLCLDQLADPSPPLLLIWPASYQLCEP